MRVPLKHYCFRSGFGFDFNHKKPSFPYHKILHNIQFLISNKDFILIIYLNKLLLIVYILLKVHVKLYIKTSHIFYKYI